MINFSRIERNVDKLKILIVDDEALLRQGLRTMLEREDFVHAVFEAGDPDEFHKQINEQSFDIILLDVRLRQSSGLELLKSIKDHPSPPKVIAVTGLDGIELMINLLKSGVHGIVYKLDGYNEILKAMKAVSTSGTYFPDNILKIIHANAHRWDNIPPVVLSFQEKELLKAIAGGSTTKEIAADLKMTEATTETYRIRLMKKVGVPNTAALLAYAYRNGIL